MSVILCPFPFVAAPNDPLFVPSVPFPIPCQIGCENAIFDPQDWNEIKRVLTALSLIGTILSLFLLLQQIIAKKSSARTRLLLVSIASLGSSIGYIIPVLNGYENTWCDNEYTPTESGGCVFQAWLVMVSTTMFACCYVFFSFHVYCTLMGSPREKKFNSNTNWATGFTIFWPQLVGVVFLSLDKYSFHQNAITCFSAFEDSWDLHFYYYPQLVLVVIGSFFMFRAIVHIALELRRLFAEGFFRDVNQSAYFKVLAGQTFLVTSILVSLSVALFYRFDVGENFDHTVQIALSWASCRLQAAVSGAEPNNICGLLPSDEITPTLANCRLQAALTGSDPNTCGVLPSGEITPSLTTVRLLAACSSGLSLTIYIAVGAKSPGSLVQVFAKTRAFLGGGFELSTARSGSLKSGSVFAETRPRNTGTDL